jgi:hypothetical protein
MEKFPFLDTVIRFNSSKYQYLHENLISVVHLVMIDLGYMVKSRDKVRNPATRFLTFSFDLKTSEQFIYQKNASNHFEICYTKKDSSDLTCSFVRTDQLFDVKIQVRIQIKYFL